MITKSNRNLHYDCSVQKEKNKELEAKARDMERKWNQEKALREVAETRFKVLKKRLKAIESLNSESDAAKEDESVCTHHTGGIHSRANSLDGTLDFTENLGAGSCSSVQSHLETTKLFGAPPVQDGSGTMDTIDRIVNQSASTGNASNLRPPTDLSNGSPPRDAASKKLPGHQSPTSIGIKVGEPGLIGVSKSLSQNKPNQAHQQQQPTNPSHLHATSDKSKMTIHGDPMSYVAQPLLATSNLGAPPRPKARSESPGSAGAMRSSNTSDFDPLRPMYQDAPGDVSGSATVGPSPTLQVYTATTPGYIDSHQHVVRAGVSSQVVEGSTDLMSFQASTMEVQGSQIDASMSMPHVPMQSAMDHQQMPSGCTFVPSLATMPLYQDHPATAAAGTQEMQKDIRQPVQQSQQHLQWAASKQQSNSNLAQPDLLSEQHTQGSLQRLPDPFDELAQKRQPSKGA